MSNSSPSNPGRHRSNRRQPALRVAVVEDHPTVLKGLLARIAAEEGFVVCGKAQNALCALKLVDGRDPDLAVIDIALQGDMNGIELTRLLKASHPDLRILILSYLFEPEYEASALAAGASAYLCKTAVANNLVVALRKIAKSCHGI